MGVANGWLRKGVSTGSLLPEQKPLDVLYSSMGMYCFLLLSTRDGLLDLTWTLVGQPL